MSDPSGDPAAQDGASGLIADVHTALALSRASVRALLHGAPQSAAQVRAELRKEAVGLDMRAAPEAKTAAANIRRLLDEG
jgi:hypothetical protein